MLLSGITPGCRSDVQTRVDDDTPAIDTIVPAPPPVTADTVRDTARIVELTAADTMPPKKNGNIRVTSPEPGDTLPTDHFKVIGTARTFENALSYRLVGADGIQLATGHLMSNGEMGRFNPFTANVNIRRSYKGSARLIVFQNSAKDGSEIDKVSIPVLIGEATAAKGEMAVEVYFTNAAQGSTTDCGKVFRVSRRIPRTEAIAEAALTQLLLGPTMQEREQSYGTEIPATAKLRSVTIDNGVATADFDGNLNRAAGSCRITAIRAQIEKTLRQFTTIRKVIISVDGKTKDVLQP